MSRLRHELVYKKSSSRLDMFCLILRGDSYLTLYKISLLKPMDCVVLRVHRYRSIALAVDCFLNTVVALSYDGVISCCSNWTRKSINVQLTSPIIHLGSSQLGYWHHTTNAYMNSRLVLTRLATSLSKPGPSFSLQSPLNPGSSRGGHSPMIHFTLQPDTGRSTQVQPIDGVSCSPQIFQETICKSVAKSLPNWYCQNSLKTANYWLFLDIALNLPQEEVQLG